MKVTTRKRALAAVVTTGALAALPIGLALPAQASTTSSGCTVNPLRPIFAGFNSSGTKLVDYRSTVVCAGNRSIQVEQRRYEEDSWPNADDFLGSSSFTRSFSGAGATTLNNVRTLVNGEIGNEEVYHNVRFRVTSGGVTSPWTAWEKSPVLSIGN